MHPIAGLSAARRRTPLSLALAALTAGVAWPGSASAGEVTVASPDGNLQVRLTDQPRPGFRVVFKGKAVVEPSPLGVTVDGADLCEGARFGRPETFRIEEKYPWRGVHSEAVNRCNGAKVPVTGGKGPGFTLEVRAFDNAVAFRHVVPGGVGPRVPDETTSFVLPAGGTVWYHDLGGHYEGTYQSKGVVDVPAGQWVAPPLTVK